MHPRVFWLLQTLTLSLLFAISAATTEASGWDSESDTEEEEDEISGGGLGEEVSRSTEQGESGFPWWILGVAASALLIVVVIISVTTYKVCQRRRSLYTAPVAQTMKDAV